MKKFLLFFLAHMLGTLVEGNASNHILTNLYRTPQYGHTTCSPEHENCKEEKKSKAVNLNFGVFNIGTQNTGPLFYNGGIKTKNFAGVNETISLKVLKSLGNSSIENLSVHYMQPFSNRNFQFVIGASSNKFHHIGKNFKALNLHIIEQNLKFGLGYSFADEPEKKIHAEFVLEMTNTKNEVRSLGLKKQDHVRKIVIGNTYEFIDSWYGKNLIDLKLKHGLPALGGSNDESAARIRQNSHTRFWIGNITLQRLQMLPYGINAGITFVGQLSDRRVAYSELMRPKTPLFLFFYPDIFFGGDSGYEYKIKLGYAMDPNKIFKKSEFYAFFAHFDLRKIGEPTRALRRLQASSTHLGFRAEFSEYASFFIELVIPSKKKIQNEKMVKKALFGVNFKGKM